MAYRVTKFESTPNPNALKCLVEPSPGPTPRSYFDAASAAGDPLGEALFAIDGVTNVLIHTAFITVCKRPDRAWGAMKKAIERVLRDAA
ncbi:MAG: scaffolding protein [Phycisphaerales bacterium]|nr:MAG: scaffolding protein [Phycisphaerales bacterium]